MINMGGLIPLFRMLIWWPLLWIARYRKNRKAVVWYLKRLQYEDYCIVWWDIGIPDVSWKEFQQRKVRRYIRRFYRLEPPIKMAKRYEW